MNAASRFLAALAAVAALASAPDARARNESRMEPIDVAMSKAHAREAADGIVFEFGAASAQGAELVSNAVANEVHVEGVGSAEPESKGGRRPDDDTVCRRAFHDAIHRLAEAAHQAGAAAVVGVVSDYRGQVIDSAQSYECREGTFHSIVALKGQLARKAADTQSPAATGFAELGDTNAPPLSDEGKARYAYFLTLPKPRAFVISEDGHWRFFWNEPMAANKALDFCATRGWRCWLYAVDDHVVWSADPARRYGSASQLASPAAAAEDEHQ